jgi:hypothetical protein
MWNHWRSRQKQGSCGLQFIYAPKQDMRESLGNKHDKGKGRDRPPAGYDTDGEEAQGSSVNRPPVHVSARKRQPGHQEAGPSTIASGLDSRPPPPANNQPGPQHMPDSHLPPPDNDEARPQDIPESPPPGSQDNEDENPSTGSERTPIANKRTKKERMKFLKSLSSHPAFISLIKTMERIKVSFSTPCWNVCLIFS